MFFFSFQQVTLLNINIFKLKIINNFKSSKLKNIFKLQNLPKPSSLYTHVIWIKNWIFKIYISHKRTVNSGLIILLHNALTKLIKTKKLLCEKYFI